MLDIARADCFYGERAACSPHPDAGTPARVWLESTLLQSCPVAVLGSHEDKVNRSTECACLLPAEFNARISPGLLDSAAMGARRVGEIGARCSRAAGAVLVARLRRQCPDGDRNGRNSRMVLTVLCAKLAHRLSFSEARSIKSQRGFLSYPKMPVDRSPAIVVIISSSLTGLTDVCLSRCLLV